MKKVICYSVFISFAMFIVGCQGPKTENQKSEQAKDTVKEIAYDIKKGEKPTPDAILELMKKGNERFVAGKSTYSHADAARIALANTENQGDYAIATVLTCSDSRVPAEMIFDAGIMDLFIIRVAGNVADTDEIGTIEYGVNHVKTPVLVVMGHSKCGAVTAVTHALEGNGHELEFNIPSLVDNIIPAAKKTLESHKEGKEEDIIPMAIEENVWQSVRDILTRSAAIREKVKSNSIKIAGAVYQLDSGKVNWLDASKVQTILDEVEKDPKKNDKVFAESTKSEKKH